jgi:hypothetical protein
MVFRYCEIARASLAEVTIKRTGSTNHGVLAKGSIKRIPDYMGSFFFFGDTGV